MGYLSLVAWCLPLADLHHLRLTKRLPKTPSAMPSSLLECHLHFASIRLCQALLFIISMTHQLCKPVVSRTLLPGDP